MTKNTIKLLGVIAIGALTGATYANAQAADTATLDLLVKKGLITETEKAQTLSSAQNAAIAATAKSPETTKITVGGYIKAGYDYVVYNPRNVKTTGSYNGFQLNYVVLEIAAKIGDNWTLFVNPEFDNGRDEGNYIDAAGITYDTLGFGKATVGLRKVNFALEETTHPTKANAIQNSVATNYFVNGLGFGSRHVGAYWDGSMEDIPGFTYGAAVTNSEQDQIGANGFNNKPAFWANVGYVTGSAHSHTGECCAMCGSGNTTTSTASGDDWSFGFGLNAGFQREGLGNWQVDDGVDDIFGYNPYITASYGPVGFTGEMIGAYISASEEGHASPFGFNATLTYDLCDQLRAVARYSWMNADEMQNISPRQIGNSADDVSGYDTYDAAWSIYAGLIYKITPSVQISAGYEFARYRDGNVADKADNHAVRTEIQAVF